MFQNDRIVVHQFSGFQQKRQGLLVAPLFEIDPPQTVGDIPIVRFQRQGLFHEFFRLVQMNTEIGVSVTEIVQGIGVVRLQDDDLFHGGNGIVFQSQLVIDDPQPEIGPLIFGVHGNGAFEQLQSLVVGLFFLVHRRQVNKKIRVIRVMRQCPLEKGYSTVDLPFVAVAECLLDDRVAVELRLGRNRLKMGHGLRIFFQVAIGQAQQVVQAAKVTAGPQNLFQQVDSIGILARLEIKSENETHQVGFASRLGHFSDQLLRLRCFSDLVIVDGHAEGGPLIPRILVQNRLVLHKGFSTGGLAVGLLLVDIDEFVAGAFEFRLNGQGIQKSLLRLFQIPAFTVNFPDEKKARIRTGKTCRHSLEDIESRVVLTVVQVKIAQQQVDVFIVRVIIQNLFVDRLGLFQILAILVDAP